MTPISAFSSTPVPGPPPSGLAGILTASLANPTEAAPGAAPIVVGEASALNWLVAWLGEQNIETEAPAAMPEEVSTPSPAPSKVQWLSLLPTVPAFEAPIPPETQDSGLAAVPDDAPVQVDAVEVPSLPIMVAERDETEEAVSVIEADPMPAPEPTPAPVTLVPTPVVAPVPTLVAVDSPTPTSPDAPKIVRNDSPRADAVPAQSTPEITTAVTGATPRPTLKPDDKGEVLWSAEFTVRETQPAETGPAETGGAEAAPVIRPQAEPMPKSLRPVEPDTPAKPSIVGVRARQPEESPRQEMGADDREPDAETPEQKRPTIDLPRERTPERNLQDSKPEASPTGNESSEPKLLDGGPRASTFNAEFVSRASVPSRVSETAPVEGVVLEPAAPIKPAQIATLQVDVPAPAGSGDMTPMRLVVSQRGDQVNVRLRSFDSSVAPIEDTRMEPLLHSLAEKGFVAELKPGARLDESMPVMVERTQEKQMVMAEPSGGQNDAQSFQNANERQQQNQERQQQQQAFFLRKQMKNVQSEAFTLPVAADANKGTFQQGASR